MKRIITILAVVISLVATCSITSSCSKATDGLEGTTWTSNLLGAQMDLVFQADAKVKWVTSLTILGQTQSSAVYGTYTYSEPNITLIITQQEGPVSIPGTISGNTLTLSEDGVSIAFTKK